MENPGPGLWSAPLLAEHQLFTASAQSSQGAVRREVTAAHPAQRKDLSLPRERTQQLSTENNSTLSLVLRTKFSFHKHNLTAKWLPVFILQTGGREGRREELADSTALSVLSPGHVRCSHLRSSQAPGSHTCHLACVVSEEPTSLAVLTGFALEIAG